MNAKSLLVPLATALFFGLLLDVPECEAGKKKARDEVELRIVIEDDEVHVTRDGVPVSPHSIVEREGQLVIVGDDGETAVMVIPHGPHRGVAEALATLRGLPGPKGLRVGLWLEPVDEALAAHLGVEADRAILVTEVEVDGPAAKAGVQRYDVITQVAGIEVDGIHDVREALEGMEEGQHLSLTVRRGGGELSLDLVPELRDLFTGGHHGLLELEELEELESVLPVLEDLERHVLFLEGESGSIAVISPEAEMREMEAEQREMEAEQRLMEREQRLMEMEQRLMEMEQRLMEMEQHREE